jgi:catechol 2,3-dioxygenase-like lactoylglutathione lyase family enzyme
MHLNHLDLHVPDPAATAEFFVTYFGFRQVAVRANGGLIILAGDAGLELVLSHAVAKFGSIDQSETRQVSYHIGFIIENRDDVEALHRNMAAGGIDLEAPREMRGGWLFYCYAPGHILVEVGARSLLQ